MASFLVKIILFLMIIGSIVGYYPEIMPEFMGGHHKHQKINHSNGKHFRSYLTNDNKLVYININYPSHPKLEINSANDEEKNIAKGFLINQYIELINFMLSEDYKNNEEVKELALSIMHNYSLQNDYVNISKSYNEIESNPAYQNEFFPVDKNDIKIIKRGNTFTINTGDKIINLILELEKIVCSEENRKVDMRAERNFLESIKAK